MNFLRFENWLKTNKAFSVLLVLLFIFGTFFQSKDILSRIKNWRSPPTYQILDLNNGVIAFVENEEDDYNFAADRVARNLVLEFDASELGDKKLGESFATSRSEIWLVKFDVTDFVANASGKLIDSGDNFYKYDDENIHLLSMEPGDGLKVTILTYLPSIQLVEIFFPAINPSEKWSEYQHYPESCCYGSSTHTAFFRIVKFKNPNSKVGHVVSFKAEYIEPESDLANRTLERLASDSLSDKYFDK